MHFLAFLGMGLVILILYYSDRGTLLEMLVIAVILSVTYAMKG